MPVLWQEVCCYLSKYYAQKIEEQINIREKELQNKNI